MKYSTLVLAGLAAAFGAFGQIFLKYGAEGRVNFVEFVNIWITFGLLLYGVGTIAWIIALSSAPLTAVYPFTALTYILVNILAITVLGERLSFNVLIGTALVLTGLFVMTR